MANPMNSEYLQILALRERGEKPPKWDEIDYKVKNHNLDIDERKMQFIAELHEILDAYGTWTYVISASELIDEYVAEIISKKSAHLADYPKSN